uniref:TF-B3 domain-containing protein n=1 Tax=Oryza punctata TaxID=4537 RepID=A0A0E0KP85_ORYPU
MVGSRGDHGGGGAARATQLKVLVPSSFGKMRICDELAAQLVGVGVGAPRATARVASPLGKVWDVGVVRDGDGRAFLGSGWAEFAAAHGLGVGWFVVLRHDGGGVLAVEAFDTTCCLKEFGASPAAMTIRSGRATDTSRKPQFLTVLLPGLMDKMRIPGKFVRDHITQENLNSNMAKILSPLGKSWRIELDKDRLGVFFGGGWLQFLSFHRISRGDVVIFRYEGNLVFKISVFGVNGLLKDFKSKGINIHQSTGEQQEAPSFSRKKCNKKNSRFREDDEIQQEMPCSRKGSGNKGRASDRETKRMKKTRSVYEIGPRSWIKKEINEYVLERCIVSLACTFCESIGFAEESTIMLMINTTSTQGGGSRSWEVAGRRYKDACYLLGRGWRRFCEDNGLKVGDVCVFTVVESTLWRVDVERC